MRVKDIMSQSVVTISPNETVVFANELMWRRQIHHLVVLDGARVVGVISDTDLGGSQAEEIPDNKQVADFMTPDVIRAEPEMTVDRALNIFRERKINCMPVMDNEKLVGIITSTDVMNLATKGVSDKIAKGAKAGPYPPLKKAFES